MKKHLIPLSLCLILFVHFEGRSQSHPWFKSKKINEHVWQIADGEIDNIYLIEGRDSALLIDTGIGAADLNSFIKTLTSRPLIIINTHSHPDHSGSNYQFKKVNAHPDDFNMLRFFGTNQMRRNIVKNMMRNPLPDSLQYITSDTLYYISKTARSR